MAIPVTPIPGTFFEWEDKSGITTPEITTVASMPLFCAVFTSDKGEEGWLRLSGQEWFDMYAVNNIVDFDKHGQPLLQTAMAINAGAEMLCKRVCAEDATLANLTIVASIDDAKETVQKKDAQGNLLYLDAQGHETVEAANPENGEAYRPATEEITIKKISYSYKTVDNCATMADVTEAIAESIAQDEAEVVTKFQKHNESNQPLYKDNKTQAETTEAKDSDGNDNEPIMDESKGTPTKIYPLWTVTDNGRGVSRKRIRIAPNYTLSKNYNNYFLYDLQVIESNNRFTAVHFCINPDTIDNGKNISFQYQVNSDSSQIKAYQYDKKLKSFIEDVIAAMGKEYEEGIALDLLFGCNKKGKPVSGLTVDLDGGVNINSVAGQILMSGSNGSFGDYPIDSKDYAPTLAKAIAGYVKDGTGVYTVLQHPNGCFDPVIYDVDRYKFEAIFDANYPALVKRAIEQLVSFREDFMFFRDMGTDCNTIEVIRARNEDNMKTKFAMTYCTAYDILDPYSKKQISVSIMYHMIQMVVQGFNNGRSIPMAGMKYGYTISDIIDDTLRFTPVVCPGLNEKEDLYDMRVNYATYIENTIVIESLYTSQEEYTQLSYGNNVIAVQEVMREIRRSCPVIRYTFIDGDDLSKYKADVEAFISKYESNFKKLEVTYLQDPYYTQNKIFYAALAVQFRDFVQTEYFKITALNSYDA